jgi:putative RecB family exonuclease
MIGEHIDAAVTVTNELADHLSPSSVRCFMDCSARWWFQYGLRLESPPNSNLSIGIAVHAGLAENFREKVTSFRDLPIEGVVALYRESWLQQLGETCFRDDEDPKHLEAVGAGLVRRYMSEVAPKIQPIAVEDWLEGIIGGVRVRARLDLIEAGGQLREIKTAGSRPSKINAMHRFQTATYRRLKEGASGLVQLDTLVKNKTPIAVAQSWTVDQADIDATEKLYPLVQDAARSGYYVPNRASYLCSKRNCAHWRACEREFGGTIE